MYKTIKPFSLLDYKFSCAEKVKYKFDSGTWYVRTSQLFYIYFILSLSVLASSPDTLRPQASSIDYSNKELSACYYRCPTLPSSAYLTI